MFDFLKTILTLTIASTSLSLMLNLADPSQAFAQDEPSAPFIEPKCDAQMIAEQGHGLTEKQYNEVIDYVLEIGRIDNNYATVLRGLIKEFYQFKPTDVSAWVIRHCGDVTIKKTGPKI